MVLAKVRQDAEEPGPDAVGVAAGAELLEALHQSALHEVGRVVLAGRHPQRMAVQNVAVPAHQKHKSVPVSSQDIADDLRIGSLHR